MKPTRRPAFLVFGVACGAALLGTILWVGTRDGGAFLPGFEDAPEIVGTPDVADRVDALGPGESGSSVSSDDARREIRAHPSGAPSLREADRNRAESILRESMESWNEMLRQAQESMDGTESALEEARAMEEITKRESWLRALANDDYVILPLSEGFTTSSSSQKVLRTVSVTDVVVDGERMRLWLAMPTDRYPEIGRAEEYTRSMARARNVDALARFNALPDEERRRLFQEQEKWEASRRRIDEAIGRGDEEGLQWAAEEFGRIGKEPLPYHKKRDDVRFLLFDR